MVQGCCVHGCSNKSSQKQGKTFHAVPKVHVKRGDNFEYKLSKKRRNKWIQVLGWKNWKPTRFSYVCSDHFINGKPAKLWDQKNPDWIPSLKLGKPKIQSFTDSQNARDQRMQQKLRMKCQALNQYHSSPVNEICCMETEEACTHENDCELSGRPSNLYDMDNPDWAPTRKMGYKMKKSKIAVKITARYKRQKERERKQISEVTEYPEVIISDFEPEPELPIPEPAPVTIKNVDVACQFEASISDHEPALPTPQLAPVIVKNADVACETDNEWLSAMQLELKQLRLDTAMELELKQLQLHTMELELKQLRLDNQHLRNQCKEQEAEISVLSMTQDSFMKDEEKLKFYTGLSLETFQSILNSIGSSVTTTVKLTQFQRLLMFLMRLKLNLHFFDIGYRFNVTQSTVNRNFHSMLDVIKDKPEILKHLPPIDTLLVKRHRKPRCLNDKRC